MTLPSRLIQVAPMMGYTDRHCRYFLRLISQNAWLFTEMMHAKAVLHGNREWLLAYHPDEHPLCLQLGGSEPNELAMASQIAAERGYDEINLNVGCPSERVKSGAFGACLMAKADLVAECVHAMQHACSVPISVKTRIGIDHQDSYAFLHDFIETVAAAGCKVFIIHARKAWLSGVSPKANREIPPLQYNTVYQLKRDFHNLTIIINGGIQSLDAAAEHLSRVDGVMIGRAAYHNSYLLAEVDRRFYQHQTIPERHTILAQFAAYLEEEKAKGTPEQKITRHSLGLFYGMPEAKKWRRWLTQANLNLSWV